MYLKNCMCGKSQKNFKMDIGPSYMDKCCKKAGYDVHGNKAEAVKVEKEEAKVEEKAAQIEEVAVEAKEEVKAKPAKKKARRRKKQ